MAANKFAQYVRLLEVIRNNRKITFDEINKKWQKDPMSYGRGDELQVRTFHNHRKAIEEIFGINIKCDTTDGYKYYIEDQENLEKDTMRCWLFDSYSVLNQIQGDVRLKDRIIFEELPSGRIWLHTIIDAIRNNSVITITHKGFGKPYANTFEIEPYYLKVVKKRWYVIARNPYFSARNRRKNKEDGGKRKEDVYMVYALDRISEVKETGDTFVLNERFDIKNFFKWSCGVIRTDEAPERIVIRAFNSQPDYIRSLPLHESQVELPSDDEGETALFEYHLCPNFEFYQIMLEQADQVEILEPASVRKQMHHFASNLMLYYKD